MGKPKRGTYLVEYWNGDKYVHGNNYKWWWTHAIELAMRKWRDGVPRDKMVKSVQYSRTPFVDDGGLKWCDAAYYQEVIDEVAAKEGRKLLPFKDYVFINSPNDLVKIDRELKRW